MSGKTADLITIAVVALAIAVMWMTRRWAMELTEAEEKAKAFDAMAENGWWIDGNLEFEGEYVCLKSPNDIVGRSKTSKLAAVEDAMSKEGGK